VQVFDGEEERLPLALTDQEVTDRLKRFLSSLLWTKLEVFLVLDPERRKLVQAGRDIYQIFVEPSAMPRVSRK